MQNGIRWAIYKGNGNFIKKDSLVAILGKEPSGTDIVSFVLNDEKVLKISGQIEGIDYRVIGNGVPDLIWEEIDAMGLDQKKAKRCYDMILEYVQEKGYN